MPANERRSAREQAVKDFNSLAARVDLQPLTSRPDPAAVVALYGSLCGAVGAADVATLRAACKLWCGNGGASLDESLLPGDAAAVDDVDFPGGEEPVRGHRRLHAARKPAFRLRAKAFMLTFNSLLLVANPELWSAFHTWVEERKQRYRATYWSTTMETSEGSADEGRVHLHCYLSWHGAGATGVDHTTTDAWVFQGVRPRVDTNTEARSPWQWLKATQHGHFYVSVYKSGTLYSATNYPPWGGLWAPDAAWVTSLWRQHKIDHAAFLTLSAKLREGHDRRKACVEAVVASEAAAEYASERAEARKLIQATAKPFKPMPDEIQRWMLQYQTAAERYKMLVLHGPSCTGKSRLARALFGEGQTLVIDVQHADHPDLRGFKRKLHKAILLDEVSSPRFIVSNKKLLQAHVDGAILGQSATQLYSYEVFLWRTPIMLTTNNWDYSTFSPADKDWLETNRIAVHIGSRVWRSGTTPSEGTPVQSPLRQGRGTASVAGTPGSQQRTWTPQDRSARRSAAMMEPGPSPEHKRAC